MDLEAFKSLIFPVRDKLYRFALRIVQSEEEAQDIVQEALIKIWKNMEKLPQVANPEAWCMTVTKNLALDTLKDKKRKVTDKLDEHIAVLEINDSDSTTEKHSDLVQRVSKLITTLPDKQRQVIHLRDIEGYSYDEISSILGFTMSQVKVTLHRARRTVREELLKEEDYEI